MKLYEVKLYSQSWVFKKQINPKTITSWISFSEQLDGGQSNINIDLIWDSSDFLCGDIVEIRETNSWVFSVNYWDDSQNWNDSQNWDDGEDKTISTYTGIIEKVSVDEFQKSELVTLEILWVFTVLNDILYESAGNFTFVKTDSVWNILKDIIDVLNAKYWVLAWNTQNLGINIITYTPDSIQSTTPTVSIKFEKNNCLEAIKKIVQNTDLKFYINEKWICFLKSEENQNKKYLTFEREIVSISKTRKKDDMINKLHLERTGWVVRTYTNASSVSNFNLKEKYESNTDIQNETTQDIQGDTKVSDFGVERNEISILIKSQKNSFLKPWDLVTTLNTKNQIVEKQITKIQKNRDTWILSIWDFTSFGKTIVKR